MRTKKLPTIIQFQICPTRIPTTHDTMNIFDSYFFKKFSSREKAYRRFIAVSFLLIGMTLVLCLFAIIFYFSRNRIPKNQPQEWGITFSKKYAEELGITWQDAYLASLDELGIRRLRIPAYWDEAEQVPGQYAFHEIDWMLDEAHARNAKVILAIGQRLPRWPECHIPLWLDDAAPSARADALLTYLDAAVKHFRTHPAVLFWQVENEPFLGTFGICPPHDTKLLRKEVDLVRALDPTRDIIITEAGELSSWITAAPYADVIGVSLYRKVWNEYIGFFTWPLPSWYYRKKAELALNHRVQDVIISEIQLEPWTQAPVATIPLEEQARLFTPSQLTNTLNYAARTGLSELYLWGVEWWYYMRLMGHPQYWDHVQETVTAARDKRLLNAYE